MSALSSQIDGLRAIKTRVRPHHLVKSGAIVRESEARHILDMVSDALETLQEVENKEA